MLFFPPRYQAVGDLLQSERCFLYLRNPHTKFGKAAFCWRRSDDIPDVSDQSWKQEPTSLPSEDPLFCSRTIYLRPWM